MQSHEVLKLNTDLGREREKLLEVGFAKIKLERRLVIVGKCQAGSMVKQRSIVNTLLTFLPLEEACKMGRVNSAFRLSFTFDNLKHLLAKHETRQ